MGVYIKGMSMPRDCPMCPMAHYNKLDEFTGCEIVPGKKYEMMRPEYANSDCRPDWCPLVEVPPHYDLIDHNALKIAVMDCDAEARIDFLKHAMDCINKAPVVIPSDMPTCEAEEGET